MAGFVLAFHDGEARSLSLWDRLRDAANTAGMTVGPVETLGWMASDGVTPPALTRVGAWTLIGDVINRSRPRLTSRPTDPLDYERKMIARFWGRFIGVRLDSSGRPAALLRDPSGAVEAVIWTQDGVTIIASAPSDWLIRVLRPAWRINIVRLKAALRDPVLLSRGMLFDGPVAVEPGAHLSLGTGVQTPLWRPSEFASEALSSRIEPEEAAERLRTAVDEAVSGLASLGGPLAAEVSGGLDSSLVAASLLSGPKPHPALWLNAVGSTPEADERAYVAALAERLGIEPTYAPHASAPMTEDVVLGVSKGFRPGLAALDVAHDEAWAHRFRTAGIQAVITGKGGDSILMQRATPDVFADVWKARGWRALAWRDAARLAAFNEVSVWTMIRHARRGGALFRPDQSLLGPEPQAVPRHPWLDDLDAFGPAKILQIAGVADVVSRHGPSRLTETVDVRHPLCMPPVTEACLSLPSALLVHGGRDRGLARYAFRDRLPAQIADRRSKGDMTEIYGRMVLANLPFLRRWLIDGRLADMGVIDPDAADRLLTRESLMRKGGYGLILLTSAFEGWVRAWETRLQPTP